MYAGSQLLVRFPLLTVYFFRCNARVYIREYLSNRYATRLSIRLAKYSIAAALSYQGCRLGLERLGLEAVSKRLVLEG